ncbi:MAG: carbon-nitrogen hydrolase family protein [Synergistaceae bacterium]|jgi:predicted amidohydrolase|nr:carbon-nitrogen hydrolase family protein [Synergistaceae bacterium]
MSESFKVAAVQMNCAPFDVAKNLGVAVDMTVAAAEKGALLVVLPELFDTGYRVEEKDSELASPIPGPTTEKMASLCRDKGIFATGTVIESANGVLYDTAFLTGPDGLVGTYRKNFLWAGEKDRFSYGDGYAVFDIGVCRLGLQICYEIGFPEGARVLALRGAEVIACPSAFGMPRLYAWDLLSRARAVENGIYVVACNRSGTEKTDTVFAANSRIVDPRGDLIASAGSEYDVITAEINLENVKKQREAIPYLKDLRRNFIADNIRECNLSTKERLG